MQALGARTAIVAPAAKLNARPTTRKSAVRAAAATAGIPIHIEYCEKWNYMPRVKMLIMKADAAHPGKFDWTYNVTDVLKATVPAGKGWYAENQAEKPIEGGENALWRKGAFEVLRLDTNELLYSKMATGEHLVDGKGGPEGKLGQFVDEVLARA